ncbi:MAG: lytic murein transglycosylase [Solirubrobacterales bacterium]
MIPRRHNRRLRARSWAALVGVLVLALSAVTATGAQGEASGVPAAESETTTSTSTATSPAPEAPAGVHGQVGEPAVGETPPAAPGGAPSSTEGTATTSAPEVTAQSPQAESAPGSSTGHGRAHRSPGKTGTGTNSNGSATKRPSKLPAPPPSTLTPPGWVGSGSLGTPISGVPDFFIESFRIPPFLLPIYQAAGTAYGIPWQVLAAINEVETDYGRDLSVSSAGAEGWMQFLPSSWVSYGVDANGDGYEDPYNPADAVFAAARYLAAAGGAQHIRAAIFSYNHSQAYVESVLLRAQLLGGTPPELLSAIAGLTESRFPVHAPAHFTDGFPAAPATGSGSGSGRGPAPLAGTVIYSQPGAPVIAVQDGEVTAVGDSPTLGRYVSLRDAYGNTYTYAELDSVAALYPVLEPRMDSAISARISRPGSGVGPRPSAPASAGVQPHSPLSQGAVSSSLAMGVAGSLEAPPAPSAGVRSAPVHPAPASAPRTFRAGPNEVYLHPLRPGVQVLAGTVLGHLGVAGEGEAAASGSVPGQPNPAIAQPNPPVGGGEPHMLFQIRPAGAGAPLIDPKPILDGWVRLEATSIFRAKGENPFLATSPTVGQVLLESKPQLEQQVLHDRAIHLAPCKRGEVRAGEVDRRVLAALEFLSVSGLRPTVAAASCGNAAGAAGARNLAGGAAGDALDISAIDGTPIVGHEGPGSIADIAVHRLLRLQGTMKPAEIVSANSYPGTDNTLTLPGHRGLIHVDFGATPGAVPAGRARAARAVDASLAPSQWIQLISRLGEIPEPAVAGAPSAAAIPDPGTSNRSPSSAAGGSPTAAPPTTSTGSGTHSNGLGGG